MNMLLLVGSIFAFSQPYSGEKLSRGLIGIPTEEGMYFSWRMTLEDAAGLQFDLYRSSNGGAEVKLNKEPIDINLRISSILCHFKLCQYRQINLLIYMKVLRHIQDFFATLC